MALFNKPPKQGTDGMGIARKSTKPSGTGEQVELQFKYLQNSVKKGYWYSSGESKIRELCRNLDPIMRESAESRIEMLKEQLPGTKANADRKQTRKTVEKFFKFIEKSLSEGRGWYAGGEARIKELAGKLDEAEREATLARLADLKAGLKK